MNSLSFASLQGWYEEVWFKKIHIHPFSMTSFKICFGHFFSSLCLFFFFFNDLKVKSVHFFSVFLP